MQDRDADVVPVGRDRWRAQELVQAQRQVAMLRLSAELAFALDETEVCRRVVEGLRDALGYDFVALFLVDENTDDRVLAASVGFVGPPARVEPGQGVSERVLAEVFHFVGDGPQFDDIALMVVVLGTAALPN